MLDRIPYRICHCRNIVAFQTSIGGLCAVHSPPATPPTGPHRSSRPSIAPTGLEDAAHTLPTALACPLFQGNRSQETIKSTRVAIPSSLLHPGDCSSCRICCEAQSPPARFILHSSFDQCHASIHDCISQRPQLTSPPHPSIPRTAASGDDSSP